jgi:RimJ/RimL family protein N-acetyltransferase
MIRKTTKNDVSAVLDIYEAAKVFMHSHDNPTQWVGSHPGAASLAKDMALDRSYVYTNEQGKVVGTFVLLLDKDPNYAKIEGAWPNELPYVTIHRLASIEKGAGSAILHYVEARYPVIRIDTHHDNYPMRNLLLKEGFVYCGVVTMDDLDGTPRDAFIRCR